MLKSLHPLWERVVGILPNLLSSLLILFLGWLAAYLLRMIARRITSFCLMRLKSLHAFRFLNRPGSIYEALPTVLGMLFFWMIIFIAATAAVETLGLEIFSRLFSDAARYFPRVFGATAILFAGILTGEAVASRVRRLGEQTHFAFTALLARGLQIFIILVVAMISIDYLGISNDVLLVTLGIAMSSVLGACSLAFGLGAKTAVSNIIAAQYLQKIYRPGQLVKIGQDQGTLVSISRTAVTLDTMESRLHIPARRFLEEASLLLRSGPTV